MEHTLTSLTDTWVGPFSLITFVIAYLFIFAEEYLKLRKSKPLMIAAGLIWIAIAVYYNAHGDTHRASEAAKHYLLEYTEIFLLRSYGFNTPPLAALKRKFSFERYPAACSGVVHFC